MASPALVEVVSSTYANGQLWLLWKHTFRQSQRLPTDRVVVKPGVTDAASNPLPTTKSQPPTYWQTRSISSAVSACWIPPSTPLSPAKSATLHWGRPIEAVSAVLPQSAFWKRGSVHKLLFLQDCLLQLLARLPPTTRNLAYLPVVVALMVTGLSEVFKLRAEASDWVSVRLFAADAPPINDRQQKAARTAAGLTLMLCLQMTGLHRSQRGAVGSLIGPGDALCTKIRSKAVADGIFVGSDLSVGLSSICQPSSNLQPAKR